LGLTGKLKNQKSCPYGQPPQIDVDSDTEWTINEVPRTQADPSLCQIIITNKDACGTCPLNPRVYGKDIPAQSDLLRYIVELNDVVSAGAHLNLDWFEWKAIALLKRKYNAAEIKAIRDKQS
jgi:hypothetical protein